MAATTSTRKKRVSKKNKISWRKNIDISDVDDFLENVRIEERLGGPFSERSNDQLFHIDTVATKKRLLDEHDRLLTKRELRKNPKPLRCFDALRNDSCVPDPISKRNVPKPGEKKIHPVRKSQETLKQTRKDDMAIRDRTRESQKRVKQKKADESANMDIWDENVLTGNLPGDTTWLRPRTLVHNTEKLMKKVGNKTKMSRVKNSVLPAVEAPHPGESYNPSYEDHQALLQKIAEHERNIIKYEKHIERVTTQMYGKPSERPTEESRLAELAEGLPFTQQSQDEDAQQDWSDTEFKALNPPVQNRKKTLQKRRKLQESKLAQLKKLASKIEKKKVADIYRLRKLEEEMKAEQAEHARLRVLRDRMRARRALEPKQMSRFKFEAPELEFNLPGQVSGNMRNLHSEGSLLRDRFKSMQKRNVIETRVKQKVKRKYKMKKFTRKSHKDGEEMLQNGTILTNKAGTPGSDGHIKL